MEARGISDIALAEQLHVRRETVWRWQEEQSRLHVERIAQIARALNMRPELLWLPPNKTPISIDAMLADQPFSVVEAVRDLVEASLRTRDAIAPAEVER